MNRLLLDFIFKKIKTKRIKEITELTLLEEDLSLFGDEAAEFIYDYSQFFDVDITNFNFTKYFTKETDFYFLYKIFPSLNKKEASLNIKDLESGIVYKRLDDSIITNK